MNGLFVKRSQKVLAGLLAGCILLMPMPISALGESPDSRTSFSTWEELKESFPISLDDTMVITRNITFSDTIVVPKGLTVTISSDNEAVNPYTITREKNFDVTTDTTKSGAMFMVSSYVDDEHETNLILSNIMIDGGSRSGFTGGPIVYNKSRLHLMGSTSLQYNTNINQNFPGGGVFDDPESNNYNDAYGVVMSGDSKITHCSFFPKGRKDYGDGGGIHSDGYLTMKNNAAIEYCTAGGSGGGVSGTYFFTMTDNAVIQNCAALGSSGGAVAGGVTMSGNAIIRNNSAEWAGGGIYSYSTDSEMKDNARLEGNTCAGDGDGMYLSRADLLISGAASVAVTDDVYVNQNSNEECRVRLGEITGSGTVACLTLTQKYDNNGNDSWQYYVDNNTHILDEYYNYYDEGEKPNLVGKYYDRFVMTHDGYTLDNDGTLKNEPLSGVSVEQADFGTVDYGNPIATKSINIVNTGAQTASIIAVLVRDTDLFTLSGSGSAVPAASGGNNGILSTWKIEPVSTIQAGWHSSPVTVIYNGGKRTSAYARLNVKGTQPNIYIHSDPYQQNYGMDVNIEFTVSFLGGNSMKDTPPTLSQVSIEATNAAVKTPLAFIPSNKDTGDDAKFTAVYTINNDPTLIGQDAVFTVNVAEGNGYSAGSKTEEVRIIGQYKPVTSIEATPNPANAGDAVAITASVTAPVNASVKPTGTVTFYNTSDSAVMSEVNQIGTPVTLSDGKAVCTINELPTNFDVYHVTAMYSGDKNYTGEQLYRTITVKKRSLTVTGLKAVDRSYDGTTTVAIDSSSAVLSGINPAHPNVSVAAYPVSGIMEDASVGTEKSVKSNDIELTGADAKYYQLTQPILTVNISKADYSGSVTGSRTVLSDTYAGGQNKTYTFDVSTILPAALPGTTYGTPTVGSNTGLIVGTPSISGSTVSFTAAPVAAGTTATILVSLTNQSFNDVTAVITITSADKQDAGVTITQNGTTFGTALPTPAVANKNGTGGSWIYVYTGTGTTVYNSATKPVNAGTYMVTVFYEDTIYAGKASASFTISPKTLASSAISAITAQVYTSSAVTPALTVKDGQTALVLDKDYTASYSSNTNVGTATVNVIFKGNYTGTGTASFTIDRKVITGTYNGAALEKVYDGSTAVGKDLTLTVDAGQFIGSDSVTAVLKNPQYASADAGTQAITGGTVELTGTGSGNYRITLIGSMTGTISTRELTLTGATVENKAYDNNTKATVVGAVFSGSVSGQTPTAAGTGAFSDSSVGSNKSVTVNSSNITLTEQWSRNYTIKSGVTVTATASIIPAPLTGSAAIVLTTDSDGNGAANSGDVLTADISALAPSGAQTGALTYQWYRNGIKIDNATAKAYTVTDSDAGKNLTVVVSVSGNYSGSVTSAAHKAGTIALYGSLSIIGTPIVSSSLSILGMPENLVFGTDYTLQWYRGGTTIDGATAQTYVVTASDLGQILTVTATAAGKIYTGSLTSESFSIPALAPSQPIIAVTTDKEQLSIEWNKPAENGKALTGYRLSVTVDGNAIEGSPFELPANATSYTVKGLTNGTTYTVQLTAINSIGSTASSAVTATPAADMTALNTAITNSDSLIESDYTEDSWALLQTALNKAKACSENDTQETVNSLTKSLNNAVATLVKKEKPAPQTEVREDTSTHVKVEAEQGVIPENASLQINEIKDNTAGFQLISNSLKDVSSKFLAFDISLLIGSEKQQPHGTLVITIPIPEGFNKNNLTIFYVDDKGNRTELPCEVIGNMIRFKTNHLSQYVLAEKNIETFSENTTTASAIPNVPTGYTASPIAIILLIVSVVLVFVAQKKKVKN